MLLRNNYICILVVIGSIWHKELSDVRGLYLVFVWYLFLGQNCESYVVTHLGVVWCKLFVRIVMNHSEGILLSTESVIHTNEI